MRQGVAESFFFAVALSFTASAAFAQTQPQRAAMALGVAQSGVVRAIDVVDGAHVEAGQPGLRKDHFEYDARSKNGLAQFGHWTAALLQ